MALFLPPKIQENPNAWGPCDPPEQFKDLPYAPFSKGDRLGKVSHTFAYWFVVCRYSGCSFVIYKMVRASLRNILNTV